MGLEYGVKDLIHTPLWGLIQEKLEGDLEWRTGRLYNGEISDIRKSRIAWIDDLYLREQLFHSVNSVSYTHLTLPTKA